nr:MAG TPA: hypothetical protein [Caudoviricetes sp.]
MAFCGGISVLILFPSLCSSTTYEFRRKNNKNICLLK